MNSALTRLFSLANAPARRIIGLMSGTSLDGLDVALCRCYGHGTTLQVTLEHFKTIPYSVSFQQQLRAISQPTISLEALTILHAEVARHHAQFVLECLQEWQVSMTEVDLLASHGQTIWHSPRHQRPTSAYAHHATMQIGDGDHLAILTGILTVSDFRQKHVAAGHEGAPLAGYADQLLFAHPTENRFLLNLGGIANFTFLPAAQGSTLTTDTGPANTLLDAVVRQHFSGLRYDENGHLAASGTTHPALLAALLAHLFFAAPLPKTTGPELFNFAFLQAAQQASHTEHLPAVDVLATLVELTATSIVQAMQRVFPGTAPCRVFVSGGGAHNVTLLSALRQQMPNAEITHTDLLGIPADAKEAILFAVLANELVAGNPKPGLGKISFPA